MSGGEWRDDPEYLAGVNVGRERATWANLAVLARALVDVAAPLAWGVDDGGGVLRLVVAAAEAAGLDGPAAIPTMRTDVVRLAERDGWVCMYCGCFLGWGHPSVSAPQVGHLVPLSRGGGKTLDNKFLGCAPCIRGKGIRTHQEYRRELRGR